MTAHMCVLLSLAFLSASLLATAAELCDGLPECKAPNDVPQNSLHLLQTRMALTRSRAEIPGEEGQEVVGAAEEAEDRSEDPADLWADLALASAMSKSVKKHMAVDGCGIEGKWAPPSDKTGSKDFGPTLLGPSGKAAVRCCSDSGKKCISPTPCKKSVTWKQAAAICKKHKRRLCTRKELEGNVCCRSGCMFDNALVWTGSGEDSESGKVSGLLAEYFGFTGKNIPPMKHMKPKFVQVDENINMKESKAPWKIGQNSKKLKKLWSTIAVRWEGEIKISRPGTYTFQLHSDDGSSLWVDKNLVINNDGLHDMELKRRPFHLSKGYHHIRIDYFDRASPAGIIFSYKGPQTRNRMTVVPPEVLFHGKMKAR
eukprot:gnl/TRDRNA2_/TRDRNA2_38581_c0_seq1.p1 gnl/TRDRNA2_/TRDRNA2_38581_c0~~gnl/TRDRNA2_/TRDRNA2_38581_c0_seq1.p1  ORF type:complete len:370 (+),score=68.15 gnl/TRDRNA2_/TRDRNA2_38581_c0_seq1:107-1216(+)